MNARVSYEASLLDSCRPSKGNGHAAPVFACLLAFFADRHGGGRVFCGLFRGQLEIPHTAFGILGLMRDATILVVDDEDLIRWSLRERLRTEGYTVREAGTGADAMDVFREGVDLVLLDYRLPDTDGLTLLREMKSLDPDVLVVLLTSFVSVETAVEAMKLGAFHFANKPFNLDEVTAIVERALETTRLRREVRQYRTDAARP